jgi:hypothetical protein
MKDLLVQYYLRQEGCGNGSGSTNGIGPMNLISQILKHEHGIGRDLGVLFRVVRTVLWNGVKALGRVTSRTGSKIFIDIADNTALDVPPATLSRKS